MSKARKLKKASKGDPSQLRFDRNYDKREAADPFYLISQLRTGAPVKYSRCNVCVGRPHCPPLLWPGGW